MGRSHSVSLGASILALDFDGVICDGMAEYLHSSWLVYCRIWSASGEPSAQVTQGFYRWRPMIEYGWEMPLLVWAIVQQVPATEMEESWHQVVQKILATEQITSAAITKVMDEVRDQQIATDLPSWLALQRCYPGTIDRLRSLPPEIEPIIITTKDGRFTRQMLENNGIHLPATGIFGKEVGQPKTETLRQLLATEPQQIWFVEDRLPTLESVIHQPGLDSVQLFLADWGYNTPAERQAAAQNPRVTVLSLDRFSQDSSCWT
jgi:phosphoglycolate phosphatase-like HAD superfamily hydrolase